MRDIEIRSVYRDRHLTPEEAEEYRKMREREEADSTPVQCASDPPTLGAVWELRFAVADLKQARLDAGLTVEEVAKRAGVTATGICELESAASDNPGWALLTRYAHAVGKQLALTVEAVDSGSDKSGRSENAAPPR